MTGTRTGLRWAAAFLSPAAVAGLLVLSEPDHPSRAHLVVQLALVLLAGVWLLRDWWRDHRAGGR